MVWLRLVGLVCCLIWLVLDNSHGLQEKPQIQCGVESMQIVVPLSLKGDHKMKILNKDGKMELLRNNSSCGIWVNKRSDGSVIVGSSYDGCYISPTYMDYVLTLGFTTRNGNEKKVTVREKVSCPARTYDDSPMPDQCDSVIRPNRLSCKSSQVSCADMGCCYDPSDRITPCYYGNKVTARCTPDGLFSVAIPKTLTKPELDLSSTHLLESSRAECNPIEKNDFFLLYQFPVSSCGTTLKVTGDHVVYENVLVATRTPLTWNRVSITRETTFRLLVRCHYAVSDFKPLKVEVVTLPPPPPVSSEGPLSFDLRISLDSTYAEYYTDADYPVIKVLRDPVFVDVRILHKTDPNLVLVLHQCWATPSPDPMNAIQWPILVNGCPFSGDNYKSELIPVVPSSSVAFPNHFSRFDVKTFTFVEVTTQEPLAGQVYFHCSVSACVPGPNDDCSTRCSRRKRSANMLRLESEPVLVSSNVPIYIRYAPPVAQNDQKGYFEAGISQSETLLNGAAIAMGLLVVVLLTLTTWTMYRQRKCKSVPISNSPMKKTVQVGTISAKCS
ncbi:zona pellucida sperm-binding protein 4 [Ranitomeya variabilis]|uniref:zona pellucida sperm-binding protein 4 n=1 Tax=Ranitomeya variabilis TaxID=490064 RepID=UPI004055AB90